MAAAAAKSAQSSSLAQADQALADAVMKKKSKKDQLEFGALAGVSLYHGPG